MIAFAPDEEIGGHNGWETFMKAPEFKELNIGTFIDGLRNSNRMDGYVTCTYDIQEGLADPTAQLGLFYGERSPYWIKVGRLPFNRIDGPDTCYFNIASIFEQPK